jgi:hypothetical protein
MEPGAPEEAGEGAAEPALTIENKSSMTKEEKRRKTQVKDKKKLEL